MIWWLWFFVLAELYSNQLRSKRGSRCWKWVPLLEVGVVTG